MKISIITPTFNSGKTIEDTIKSVVSQTYQDIEYIIVDGGSTDDTLKKLEQYKDHITKVISAPPKGIYDAMNKGIEATTGDVVGIINSDDFYANDRVIDRVMREFLDEHVDAAYGDLVFVDQKNINAIKRTWNAGEYKEWKLNYGWIMPHPAFFVRKKMYDVHGLFRLDMSIAADFELLLRFSKKGKISIVHIPEILVKMRTGGVSTKNIKNRIEGMRQLIRAWKVNGLPVPVFFYLRPLFKVGQFLDRGKRSEIRGKREEISNS